MSRTVTFWIRLVVNIVMQKNETWLCCGREPWQSQFVAIIEKRLSKSCIVRIVSTETWDDHLIDYYLGRTVIENKKLIRKI